MKILDISLSDKEELSSLISLYKEVFKKELEPEELLWRYKENPEIGVGFHTNTVIRSENNILAHTAVTPKNFEISKHTIKGCLSGGSMVGKKAHGAFPIIFDHMIKRLKDNKFDFVYAFPNEQSAPFLIKYFGFNESFMAYLTLRHDDLKENLNPYEICFQNKIRKKQSKYYINWRFNSFQKSQSIETDTLKIFYKSYNNIECDILSIVPKNEINYSSDNLIQALLKIPKFKKYNYLTTDKTKYKALKSIGFKEGSIKNKFVYLWLSDKFKDKDIALEMCDNDW